MFHNSVVIFFGSKRNLCRYALAYFSLIGATLGVLVSYNANPLILSMMRMAASLHVSIVDLLFLNLFPLLITAVVSVTEKTSLFYLLSLFKSFLYAYAVSTVCIAFGSGGWLVSCMLLVTNSICFMLIFWYWLRHIDGLKPSAMTDMLFVCIVSLTVGLADVFIISPYLGTLVKS